MKTDVKTDLNTDVKNDSNRRAVRLFAVTLMVVSGLVVTAVPAQAGGVAATSSARSRPPATVPPAAFLQPADLGGATTEPLEPSSFPEFRPPQPCDADGFRSVVARRTNAAILVVYPVQESPTVLVEDIGLYRGGGAARYMAELRRAFNRCGECTDATGQWTVLDRGPVGRSSMLIRLRQNVDVGGSVFVKDTYVFVARVGEAVVVLIDRGWEESSGHEDVVRALAPVAVRRARAALR